MVFYNEMGARTEQYLLDPSAGNYGVQIPARTVAYGRGCRAFRNLWKLKTAPIHRYNPKTCLTDGRILLCKPKMCGRELEFIKAALAEDWIGHRRRASGTDSLRSRPRRRSTGTVVHLLRFEPPRHLSGSYAGVRRFRKGFMEYRPRPARRGNQRPHRKDRAYAQGNHPRSPIRYAISNRPHHGNRRPLRHPRRRRCRRRLRLPDTAVRCWAHSAATAFCRSTATR